MRPGRPPVSGEVEVGWRERSAGRRRPALVGGALLALLLLCAGLAAAPILFKGASLRSEIAEQVRSTAGLTLTADGPVRFRLFPQPHVEMADLHIIDRTGALRIDATGLEGQVRFLPLLVGRLEIASAALERPHLSIDLDAGPAPADRAVGRALRSDAPRGAPGSQRLGIVTLVDGTAVLKSKARAHDVVVDAVNLTVDWRSLDAPATLTGAVTFRGHSAEVAAWVAQPSSLLRGDSSAITLRVRSAPLDLSANGVFAGSPAAGYHGRITASAPSLPDALALAGIDAALPAPFADFTLTSDATVGGGTLDLPNLRLQLDGNAFEGTLAYQGNGGAPTLSGTLATEQFSLVPFLAKAPPLLDPARRWSRERVRPDRRDQLRLDLRISATHLRLPPYVIDDAALAVMTRDGRTDVALVEGKTYGGTLKGHASVGLSGGNFSVRAAGALTAADAGALSWDLFGRQVAAGSLSVSANLESAGDSAGALVGSLRGWAKGRVGDGELSGVDLGLALRDRDANDEDGASAALRKGRTPFEAADFSFQIADGVATIDSAGLKGPDATLRIGGKADLAQRRFDLRSAASLSSTSSLPSATGALVFTIKGPFDQAVVTPEPAPPKP